MDWANERYCRLYTRDTTTWKLLGWEGQTVLMHLLRKLDRGGRLPLEGLSAEDVIVLHTGLPPTLVESGWASLVKREVFTSDGKHALMAQFRDAQEAKMSQAQRKRDQRERDAASVTSGDHSSHAMGPERYDRAHNKSKRDNKSQMSPQPSLAEPNQPSRAEDPARETWISVWGIYEDLTGAQGSSHYHQRACEDILRAAKGDLGAIREVMARWVEAKGGTPNLKWLASDWDAWREPRATKPSENREDLEIEWKRRVRKWRGEYQIYQPDSDDISVGRYLASQLGLINETAGKIGKPPLPDDTSKLTEANP